MTPQPTPKPTDQPSALFVIEHYLDGVWISTTEVVWQGWTARDAIRNRCRRWRNARATYTREGNVLTSTGPDGRFERYTVTDVTP